MLYFRQTLDHSFIDPNQIHSYDIPVSDDLFDMARKFGINTDELFIPFLTGESTIYFESHVSLDDELEYCSHIKLTDYQQKWNLSE